ncbi:MAG: GWxTD domain-containing protein [Armatimonadetes bacterium]|nr:GWxTD domain-containing protein [Armatimonadota bacterium]
MDNNIRIGKTMVRAAVSCLGPQCAIAAFFLFLLAIPSAAQVPASRQPPTLEQLAAMGDDYFLEVTTLPGNEAGRGRAIISFRLSYDLLNFRKAGRDADGAEAYIATPALYAEAIGSDGVVVGSGEWSDTVRVVGYGGTNSRSLFVCGVVELQLRPDIYTFSYSLRDGAIEPVFRQTTPPQVMDDFRSNSPAIGTPLFLRRTSGDTMTAAGIDGNAKFGGPLVAYVPLASRVGPGTLGWQLLNAPSASGDGDHSTTPVAEGNGELLGAMTLSQADCNQGYISVMGLREGIPPGAYGAIVNIPSAGLPPAEYLLVLTLHAGGSSVTDTVPFALRWIDMPVSLLRPEYAIRALYPIAPEDTIDELLSGSKEDRAEALNNFWQQRDPTPATRYNERMAEYYRRVDYAYFNFKNLEQRDGVQSDRGKIYILYGPPTTVDWQMQPGASPREVWTYRNAVNRQFIFADGGATGAYRLIEYHDL